MSGSAKISLTDSRTAMKSRGLDGAHGFQQ